MESIIWFLVIGVLFYFMMKHSCGSHMGGHGRQGGHGGLGEDTPTAQTVKDPVCGMEIDKDKAFAMTRREGKPVYFCSENCQKKFNETPGRYQ